jgi:hypothetical protein
VTEMQEGIPMGLFASVISTLENMTIRRQIEYSLILTDGKVWNCAQNGWGGGRNLGGQREGDCTRMTGMRSRILTYLPTWIWTRTSIRKYTHTYNLQFFVILVQYVVYHQWFNLFPFHPGGDACYEEDAEHALMSKRQRMLSSSRPSTSKADQMLMISSGFDLRWQKELWNWSLSTKFPVSYCPQHTVRTINEDHCTVCRGSFRNLSLDSVWMASFNIH